MNTRWNHPDGHQLKLLRDRCITGAEGWSTFPYEMFQHRHGGEKQLGALVQMCLARQLAPPWESNNHNRRTTMFHYV